MNLDGSMGPFNFSYVNGITGQTVITLIFFTLSKLNLLFFLYSIF